MKYLLFLSLTLFLLMESCQKQSTRSLRGQLDLSGPWNFRLDSTNSGISEKWPQQQFSDSVNLPGTLDENHVGVINHNREETMRLSRERTYEGKAWYQKKIVIPKSWENKRTELYLERAKPSKVWLDTVLIGSSNHILTPQIFDLTGKLTPGTHTLTILIDNGKGVVPEGITGSHAWTEHTQTNWNGILGGIRLMCKPKAYIENAILDPDIKTNSLDIKLRLNLSGWKSQEATLTFQAEAFNTKINHRIDPVVIKIQIPSTQRNAFQYHYRLPLGDKAQYWSEFNPALYKITITLGDQEPMDHIILTAGLRKFSTKGTQFTINNQITFLRGKHDACVFPLTAHPPMDVDSWRKVFRIAKSYQINFYRFHSWTPPQAAFEAADLEGIYLQPELPFWGSLSRDEHKDLNEYLIQTGEDILSTYGNHASFVMFALGNELSGDQEVMKTMVNHFRALDKNKLYAYGSNNYLGTAGQAHGEDYYAACRVGADTDTTYRTQIRASFSFADANQGGYLNGLYPSLNKDYRGAISQCSVPAMGTEIGQYQIYPNYAELKKYTGVLKPWNLEIFQKRLEENNLSSQAMDFFKASGALSALCYKADIEMALRTPGFGGFHLLDLQDFPGQGTALVGLLDAFMDSKGLITPQQFSEFCNRVVPLWKSDRYCWDNHEVLTGTVELANYGPEAIQNRKMIWNLKTAEGKEIISGTAPIHSIQGSLTKITDLEIPLQKIKKAEKLILSLEVEGLPYKNHYELWVYPYLPKVEIPASIWVVNKLSKETLKKLTEGATILYIPDSKSLKGMTVGGLFTPDYWNYRMFKGISEWLKKPVSPGTLSILTKPELPLFQNFPTEFHSNWQWWSIVKHSTPFILDRAPKDYEPLIQVIDNVERNHKLGLVFEFSAGKGKMLVCMCDLQAIQDKPEGRQFYYSLIEYMKSSNFRPAYTLKPEQISNLFNSEIKKRQISGVKNISYQ